MPLLVPTTGTPEDLVLNGHLSHFFARKGITFDLETGLFRITNHYRYKIRLTGHGQKYAMARKALQRNEILRIKILKSDGTDQANVSIPYTDEYSVRESVFGIDAVAYNLVDGKIVNKLLQLCD